MVGDDVAFGPRLDAPDGDHDRLARAGLDRLETDHDHRREDDRVDGGLGHRAVRPTTMQRDEHAVGGRQGWSGVSADEIRRRRPDSP